MKKRILAVLLIFAFAITPALAAGTTTRVLTRDGPVWVGIQGEGSDSVLVYSADRGKSWNATEGFGGGLGGLQDVQYTGRDYFLTGFWCKMAYTSTDGINWTALSNAYWFDENAEYITSGLSSGKYQLIWTGSEYMMQQSIKGEPRSTHPSMGDSPRNKAVTFLNESYEIIGGMAFDGEVESIRYKNGTYYATVGGVEHSFTRADWENSFEGPGIVSRQFWSDGTVIFRREFNQISRTRTMYSYDGVNWQMAPEGEDRVDISISTGRNFGRTLVPTGRGFLRLSSGIGDWLATTDGIVWFSIAEKEWVQECAEGWTPIGIEGGHSIQLVWTGAEYLVCQNIYRNPPDFRQVSPGNTKVIFLDENYNMVKQYNFGGQVYEADFRDGSYYARVETTDLDSGASTQTVFSSQDGEKWEKTNLENIPRYTAAGRKELELDDLSAGKYALRREGGNLLVSDDGVYFTKLGAVPTYKTIVGELPYEWGQAYAGRDGVLLCFTAEIDGKGIEQVVTYANADIAAVLTAAFPGARYYATLDGAYISFDNPPYEKNSRMMVPLRGVSEALGFTVEYDDAGVTCTKGDTVITVTFGSAEAKVNGETYTLEAPVEIYRDRTYVPIRFFSEQMGLDVAWNGETGTAALTTR